MRYIDFLLIPKERYLHPATAAIAADSGVSREAVHHFNVLEDGTAVVLMEFSGAVERLDELARRLPRPAGAVDDRREILQPAERLQRVRPGVDAGLP